MTTGEMTATGTLLPTGGVGEAPRLDLLRRRLKAVVFLAGSVRPNQLTEATQRSLLDLPLDRRVSVMDDWRAHIAGLANRLGRTDLPVRVMVNQGGPAPKLRDVEDRLAVTVERDPNDFRGTAGLLRDVTRAYEPDELVLVIAGMQVLFEPLPDVLTRMVDPEAGVSLLSHADGTPSALMLVRVGALNTVRPRGFQDLKEQLLPELALTRSVKAVESRRPIAAPIRTLDDYIRAIRRYHLAKGGTTDDSPFGEHWRPTFQLAETPGDVEDGARVHDSVVLEGGRVAAGARVVNSVVTPWGVVGSKELIIDRIVGKDSSNKRKARR